MKNWPTAYLKERLLEAKKRTGLSIRGMAKESGASIASIHRAINGKEVNYSNGKVIEKWSLWAKAK
jgi:hypothetical protein